MKRPDAVTIIAVLVLSLVLAGAVLEHSFYPGEYRAEGTSTATGADFILESTLSTEYAVVAIDNGTEIPVSKLYIFIDPDYVPYCTSASGADSYITQFEKELQRRGFDNFQRTDAEELLALMDEDPAVGEGILIPFGTLPDTVYTGNPSDEFTKWTAAGGTVYWMGGIPGAYSVSKGQDAVEVFSPETVFPFVEGASEEEAISDIPVNSMCTGLSMVTSSTRFALSPDYPGVKGMGMKASDGRCSVSVVKDGPGTFFVIAGIPGDLQRHDLSAIIAAGVTYQSEVLAIENGEFKGSMTGTLEYSGANVSVYALYGGYFPIYGKRIIG